MRVSRNVNKGTTKNSTILGTNLYTEDLEYLREHGIQVAVALRRALHEYVLVQKDIQKGKPNFEKMTREERMAWVLAAPDGDSHQPGDLQTTWAEEVRAKPHEPVPDMTGWTREERGAWILDGVIPDRVMMIKKTGARVKS